MTGIINLKNHYLLELYCFKKLYITHDELKKKQSYLVQISTDILSLRLEQNLHLTHLIHAYEN